MGGRGSGPRVNEARDREIVRLRDQGLSLAGIGRLVGLTKQAVKAALDRLGYADSPGALRRAPGFAYLTPEQRREISARGGRAAQAARKAHRFTVEEARAAGGMAHGRGGASGG